MPGIGEDSSDGGEGKGIDTLCSDLKDKDNYKDDSAEGVKVKE